jgi:hypothetical protein
VSLGCRCETKFQLSRVRYEQATGRRSGAAFRTALLAPDRGAAVFGYDIFDQRGVNLLNLSEILERDFEGVFEQADLELRDGDVWHKYLGTTHLHEFETPWEQGAAGWTEATIGERYPEVRTKYDAWLEDFRRMQRSPGPVLYVHAPDDVTHPWPIWRLLEALSARSSVHRFKLLVVAPDDLETDLDMFGDLVVVAKRPRVPNKPESRHWEGDDAAWDAALAPFALAPPRIAERLGAEPR